MATDLKHGAIPAIYREIYKLLTSDDQESLDYDTFINVFTSSTGLTKQVLSQIWESVDIKQDSISRSGLYKALVYIYLAQNGKPLNEKFLESFQGMELPIPTLGEICNFKAKIIAVRRERSTRALCYTIKELEEFDNISIKVSPEKKGILLKHVEYEIYSNKYKKAVHRRYNDFFALNELLLLRFPYRIIPRLPPKKIIGADSEFIELRRKGLKRYLTLCVRHPFLRNDEIIKYFLTFTGTDTGHKMKEYFKGFPDEFMTNENINNLKISEDASIQFNTSRQFFQQFEFICAFIREIIDRQVKRSNNYASDILHLNESINELSNITTPVTTWSSGDSKVWKNIKFGLKNISGEFTAISKVASIQTKNEDELVLDKISLLLELLYGYRDLCIRHEKGVLHDHQRALSKINLYKNNGKKVNGYNNNNNEAEDMNARILLQENAIANLENRNIFALNCIRLETQLLHIYLTYLYTTIDSFINCEITACTELSLAWKQLQPIVENLLTSDDQTKRFTNETL